MITNEKLIELADGDNNLLKKLEALCQTNEGQARLLSLYEKGFTGKQIVEEINKN
jgi:hypothetical protein